jgi:hypothetical protein
MRQIVLPKSEMRPSPMTDDSNLKYRPAVRDVSRTGESQPNFSVKDEMLWLTANRSSLPD